MILQDRWTAQDLNSHEKAMNCYWNERSYSYSRMNRSQFYSDRRAVWEEAIFELVDEGKRLKVLDIGTGPGFFALICASRGHEVTAVDMNANMLHQAKKHASAEGLDIRFLQVGHSLPFEKGQFDLILARDVTWTLTEPKEQLADWFSLLKAGGKLIYFDAEWNYHLKSRAHFEHWSAVKKRMEEAGIDFYPKAEQLNVIASALPMTYEQRPQFDEAFWKSQECVCQITEAMNERLFHGSDLIRYQAHPVFRVSVEKQVNPEEEYMTEQRKG